MLSKKKIKTLFPMAGNVEEFINEFDKNKFIIRIDGMPMIEKITFDYIEYIEPIYLITENEVKARIFHQIADRNKATIVSISSKTESVLHTLLCADELINDSDEVLIIHPDSLMEFNFCDFLKTINDSDPDGILLSYDGFNPSDIESEDFARITINGNQVLNVIEKSALTASQCTSAGGYYFRSWSLFKEALHYQLKYQR